MSTRRHFPIQHVIIAVERDLKKAIAAVRHSAGDAERSLDSAPNPREIASRIASVQGDLARGQQTAALHFAAALRSLQNYVSEAILAEDKEESDAP